MFFRKVWGYIKNKTNKQFSDLTEIAITVKDKNGKVIKKEETYCDTLFPKDEIYVYTYLIDVSNIDTVEYKIKFEEDYSSEKYINEELYSISNTDVRAEENNEYTITGEIEASIESDTDTTVFAIFMREGKMVALDYTYVDLESKGDKESFEINTDALPQFDEVVFRGQHS